MKTDKTRLVAEIAINTLKLNLFDAQSLDKTDGNVSAFDIIEEGIKDKLRSIFGNVDDSIFEVKVKFQ